MLQQLKIKTYRTRKGADYHQLPLSYETFGQPLGSAPVVLVNHALTGNSTVSGETGWWSTLIGDHKAIDTRNYCVLAFNIPGNGYDGFLIDHYEDFEVYDIAQLFLSGLDHLGIKDLFAMIGGSLGGNIAWQMAVLRPCLTTHLIPIAADWKATDWLVANCHIQKNILNTSSTPIETARAHAMTLYRTPASLKHKFNRGIQTDSTLYQVESWLIHHGNALQNRFTCNAYKLMNHLLMSTNCAVDTDNFKEKAASISASIHLIGIDTDAFFTADEILETYHLLNTLNKDVHYHGISSIHGHDAFLIEYKQLTTIIETIFKNNLQTITEMNSTETTQKSQLISVKPPRNNRINIAVFGHGQVGGKLINQILAAKESIANRRDLDLHIFAIANSKKLVLSKATFNSNWEQEIAKNGKEYCINDVVDFAKANSLKHLIAIDNTASAEFVEQYPRLISHGFNLVSSNKIANTIDLDFYNATRKLLTDYNKEYLYETNVGAGLPLVDTIKLLHLSGENITRIKGVFSGSLSYLFNTYSDGNQKFSSILKDAVEKGFTEPNPSEDLCGNDVARKLLILARELELSNELSDVKVENLIPKSLQNCSKEEFLSRIEEFDPIYDTIRKDQKDDYVLRYIGDLHGDLSSTTGGILEVKLVSVSKNTSIGQMKGSDSIFEIYTESYGENPIVIQGAGAGASVTARGVFGDILRLSNKLN